MTTAHQVQISGSVKLAPGVLQIGLLFIIINIRSEMNIRCTPPGLKYQANLLTLCFRSCCYKNALEYAISRLKKLKIFWTWVKPPPPTSPLQHPKPKN